MIIYLSLIESQDDKTKFELIYIKYRTLMFHIANQILNNAMDAEDAVHQSFLKIIKILNQIEVPVCPKTKGLIVIIVERTAIDFKRKRNRKVILSFDDENINIPARSKIDSIPDKTNLATAMAMLSTKYRELLLLKYDCGFSEHEIAQILSMTEANIKKTIQRAKVKLGTILEQLEAETE